MYIIFDTETTGLPKRHQAPVSDTDNWPRVVQLAWQLHDDLGNLIEDKSFLILPDGFDIPYDAEQVHGISTALAAKYGVPLKEALLDFERSLQRATFVVGHNVEFDLNVTGCEYFRAGMDSVLLNLPILDTCTQQTAQLCKIPGGRGGGFKYPTLAELYGHLFGEGFQEAHNATADVEATTRCFLELVRLGHFSTEQLGKDAAYPQAFRERNPERIALTGLTHLNLKAESAKLKARDTAPAEHRIDRESVIHDLAEYSFAHLHNHSQFSLLQSTIEINALVKKAASLNMKALALTDTGNMMGAFHFERAVSKHNAAVAKERKEAEEKGEVYTKNEILPIIGCEFNVCANRLDKSVKDNGYQIVFLAKNRNGYNNLIKLASIAYSEGMYYVPRIDRQVIENYAKDLIVLTGNLYGEVPNMILNLGEKQAEEALLWWKGLFGSDLYIEIMRHGQENEDRVNEVLIRFAQKHQVKLVATNNTYYLEKEDAETHDVLLCVKDNELVTTPVGRGRGYRYGLDNHEYYFKSQDAMKELFLDLPEAIMSIDEIIAKCEPYGLAREVLLPVFDIPDEFKDPRDAVEGTKHGENNYLRHLTYKGAEKRYGEISDELRERIDFELATIENTGYPGYFLIVQDFCHAAREMGVSVGPGRGSAAGSVVAYCIGITNVDPIRYDLLFERFLNPDRVSLPDIDIDFDDEGRGRVIDWVIKKYGSNQVAQIITYGTMAAKSAIRDTARVLDLSLPEADRIAKLMPDISLKELFALDDQDLHQKFEKKPDELKKALEFRLMAKGNDLNARVIQQAKKIEGSLRNTGIHACGVIITPDDITNFVPVATAKDSDMFCTQFDNSVAENAGLLKMDFLGLKTLTQIKDAVKNVKLTRGEDLDPDAFPVDDERTYTLFQRGETVGIFQYESPGMQKYLRELQPTVFEDLIAMNALYRPGPIEYIPSFIRRKHGEEDIVYDVDACEEYLKETYGITVYQEQVMLLSQKLANFTKGEADTLRKAMGKKLTVELAKMKPIFMERGAGNGHDVAKLEKIWKDWEAFASYAFNKSHSTCYAWIAYQTAYLKANYPAEFMAAVLSNNMNDIKQVSFFMEECRRMGIEVLGPDINESNYHFTVNKEGAIRFGLGAIKGLGMGPVQEIMEERERNGSFGNIFELARRVSTRACNKKALESMVYAGCFDSFKNVHRAQYFKEDGSRTFIENIIRYGSNFQGEEESSQASLFGGDSGVKLPEPVIPPCEEWNSIYALNKEKEVIGMFISGHPLDDFKHEITSFCSGTVGMLNNLEDHKGKDLLIAGIVTEGEHRFTKKGEQFGTLTLEDYTDSFKLFLWRDNYLKYRHFLTPGTFVTIRGRIEIPPRRNELEFTIHSIELLQKLMETRAKAFRLKIENKALTQPLIDDLGRIFENHPGSCPVEFAVYDPIDNLEVNLSSRSLKVELTNTMFKALEPYGLSFEIK